MYSIIHAVESFSDEEYIKKLTETMPAPLELAPLWTENLFNRIFNDLNCLKIFQQNIYKVPRDKLIILFDLMEKESPHHKEKIKELRALLEKSPDTKS